MSDDSAASSASSARPETSRRRLLAWMGAGGAAALTALVSRNDARAGHDGTNALHLGEGNSTPPGRKTGIASNVDAFSVDVDNFHAGPTAGGLHGRSLGGLPALQGVGHEPSFAGVFGISASPSGDFGGGSRVGVMGLSANGVGVQGTSRTGTGGTFSSESGHALTVVGRSSMTAEIAATDGDTLFIDNRMTGPNGGGAISALARGDNHALEGVTDGLGVGVVGVAGSDPYAEGPGDGVHGTTGSGTGVDGHSRSGTGVRARSETGVALSVEGPARFSTAGGGELPAGVDSVFVPVPAVTGDSHVSITLTGDPGARQITWVERDPGSGFTVHTSKKAPATAFTYLVVEPA
jgi:hypothetical protein